MRSISVETVYQRSAPEARLAAPAADCEGCFRPVGCLCMVERARTQPPMLPLRDQLPTRRFPFVNYALLASTSPFSRGSGSSSPAATRPGSWSTSGAWSRRGFSRARSTSRSRCSRACSCTIRGAGCTSAATCSSSGSSATTSRTRSATGATLIFYLASGCAAAAAQILIDPSSTMPMVGASGAIAGALAAYGSLYPFAPITILNPIPLLWFFFGLFLELPAWVVILEFFIFNVWHGLGSLGTERRRRGVLRPPRRLRRGPAPRPFAARSAAETASGPVDRPPSAPEPAGGAGRGMVRGPAFEVASRSPPVPDLGCPGLAPSLCSPASR